MDISSDKHSPDVSRPAPFSTVMQVMLGLVRRLIGFFEFNEEDRLKAGIYVGGEGRDG